MAQSDRLAPVAFAAEQRKHIHKLAATRTDEAFLQRLESLAESWQQTSCPFDGPYWQAICLENTITELIQIGSRAHNIVTAAEREGSAHTCNKHLATLHALAFFTCHLTNIMIVNSARRIAPQLTAAGNQLEYLPRHSWRALRFQLENPSAALACEEALLQEVAEQIKVFGLVAAATRDNALFSRMACAEDLTGIRLVKLYMERAMAQGQEDKSQLELTAPALWTGTWIVYLAHLLAMVNYEGLWAEEDRKTVLDMDIPKTMLDFAELLMAWIPTLKRDPELNAWTWTILDVAMVRVHAAVIVLICNGVASQIVKEKTLVAHFARTNDRFSSLVAERKKLYARHAPPDDDNVGVIGAVEAYVDACTESDSTAVTIGRKLRKDYKPYKEDESAQFILRSAMSDLGNYVLTDSSNTVVSACLACGKFDSVDLPHKLCAYCPTATYCSIACQKADWKAGHKAICLKPKA